MSRLRKVLAFGRAVLDELADPHGRQRRTDEQIYGFAPEDLDQATATLAATKDFLHTLPAADAHRVIARRILESVFDARRHRDQQGKAARRG